MEIFVPLGQECWDFLWGKLAFGSMFGFLWFLCWLCRLLWVRFTSYLLLIGILRFLHWSKMKKQQITFLSCFHWRKKESLILGYETVSFKNLNEKLQHLFKKTCFMKLNVKTTGTHLSMCVHATSLHPSHNIPQSPHLTNKNQTFPI